MVAPTGTGAAPLFPLPHDETDLGELTRASQTAGRQFDGLGAVQTALEGRTRTATGEVSDDLVGPVLTSARPETRRAADLALASLAASGTMRAYAEAVETYNGVVDELNREYEAARGQDFSVASDAGATDDMSDDEKADARAEAVDAADLALRRELGQREQTARDALDRTGTQLAGNLDRHPGETLAGLAETGPLAAPGATVQDPVMWVLRALGLAPAEDADGVGATSYGFGIAGLGFGTYVDWKQRVGSGVWQPKFRNASGSWVWGTNRGWSPWQRFTLAVRPGASTRDFRATPHQSATRSAWGTAGRWAGRVGTGVTAATAGWNQWQDDADDPTLDTAERVDRTATTSVSTAAGAFAGAKGGAWVGGAIGTAICPGVGTVIGAAVGGLVGGAAGAFAGDQLGDWVNDTFDGAGHMVSEGVSAAGEGLKDAAGWVGGKLGFG